MILCAPSAHGLGIKATFLGSGWDAQELIDRRGATAEFVTLLPTIRQATLTDRAGFSPDYQANTIVSHCLCALSMTPLFIG